jgi:hypothetical protein
VQWLDKYLEGTEAKQQAEPIAAQEPRVVRTVWIQTRPPRNGDQGGTEPGWYFVEDGVVVMCSEESGEPTGKTHTLAKGEDAKQIAGRMRRSAWLKEQNVGGVSGDADWNRPLSYARIGVA